MSKNIIQDLAALETEYDMAVLRLIDYLENAAKESEHIDRIRQRLHRLARKNKVELPSQPIIFDSFAKAAQEAVRQLRKDVKDDR